MRDKNILAVLIALFSSEAQSEGYDPALLEKLGISTEAIDKIKNNEIPEGINSVNIFINGKPYGLHSFEFHGKGNNFVFFKDKINDFRLKTKNIEVPEEFKFLDVFPEANITYRNGEIRIVVPNYYINNDINYIQQTGFGVFSNYDFNYFESSNGDPSFYTKFENGLNYKGFIYRNSFSTLDDEVNIDYNYIQKNDLKRNVEYRVGNIQTKNPFYSGVSVIGAQVSNLNKSNSRNVIINGFLDEDSRIDVFLDGEKIYESRFSKGYYEIDNINIPVSNNPLIVREYSLNGTFNEREVYPEVVSLLLNEYQDYGLTIGKTDDRHEFAISAYKDVYKNNMLFVNSGAFYSDNYLNLGVGLNMGIEYFNNLSFNLNVSDKNREDYNETGFQGQALISKDFFDLFRTSLSYNYFSEEYSYYDFDESNNSKDSLSLNVSTDFIYFDNLSASYSQNTYHDESDTDHSFSVNLSKQYSRNNMNISYTQTNEDKNILFTFSIPLDSFISNVRFSTDYRDDEFRNSVNMSGSNRDYELDYYLNLNQSKTSKDASIHLDKKIYNSYLRGGYYQNDLGNNNRYLRFEGGIVYTKEGLATTANKVGDTFAIIKIKDLENVKISSTNGDLITNSNGIAVLANVNDSIENELLVDTRTLPKNKDLDNAIKEMKIPHGNVEFIEFEVKPMSSQLLKITKEDGTPVNRGSSIYTSKREFVTVVTEHGLTFIEDIILDEDYVIVEGNNKCTFTVDEKTLTSESRIKKILCKKP